MPIRSIHKITGEEAGRAISNGFPDVSHRGDPGRSNWQALPIQ